MIFFWDNWFCLDQRIFWGTNVYEDVLDFLFFGHKDVLDFLEFQLKLFFSPRILGPLPLGGLRPWPNWPSGRAGPNNMVSISWFWHDYYGISTKKPIQLSLKLLKTHKYQIDGFAKKCWMRIVGFFFFFTRIKKKNVIKKDLALNSKMCLSWSWLVGGRWKKL